MEDYCNKKIADVLQRSKCEYLYLHYDHKVTQQIFSLTKKVYRSQNNGVIKMCDLMWKHGIYSHPFFITVYKSRRN